MTRMSQRYPQELKDRAVRLVTEVVEQQQVTEWAAIGSVAGKRGVGSAETPTWPDALLK